MARATSARRRPAAPRVQSGAPCLRTTKGGETRWAEGLSPVRKTTPAARSTSTAATGVSTKRVPARRFARPARIRSRLIECATLPLGTKTVRHGSGPAAAKSRRVQNILIIVSEACNQTVTSGVTPRRFFSPPPAEIPQTALRPSNTAAKPSTITSDSRTIRSWRHPRVDLGDHTQRRFR
jgi:hypothetical protein